MRIKETKVYEYAELSDDAKAKARDWYREITAGSNDFAEFITSDFQETLKALGFDTREKDISWSGFWSQGNGAAFAGNWRASNCDPAALLADRPPTWGHTDGVPTPCPSNVELHRIAAEILACKAAGMTYAAISQSRRGFFMSLDSSDHGEPDEATIAEWNALHAEQAETSERLITAARDLAHAFYRALEAEYEYQNSDEQVAEAIEANEYEFTEYGERA